MRRSPDAKRLEDLLRSSRIVAGGFLGHDTRIPEEIIEADARELARLGYTVGRIAARMRELTDKGRSGLGTPVRVDGKWEVIVDENRGRTVCPWPHPGTYTKTVMTVRRLDTGEGVRWSDLSLHLLEAHGFLQGEGSAFRLDPGELVRVLFG